jgi:hypothetical protein
MGADCVALWRRTMPLLRYFTYVGGALMALLLVASYVLPEPPTVPHYDVARPVIRITSDRVGPPRVDLDTRVQKVATVPLLAPGVLPRTPVRLAEAQAFSPLPTLAAPVLTPAAPVKPGIRNEIKKAKVARRLDRRPIAAYPQVAAYPQTFQPFRLTW